MTKSSIIRIAISLLAIISYGLFCSNNGYGQKPINDLKPTTILISIDGFRADYLDIYQASTLRKIGKAGTRAQWLIPSFPSKTFPNHYTIVTGLYPEHHGIIANDIYDPEFDAVFGLDDRKAVEDPRWWMGEPIWATAEKHGQIAASYFFPGSETKIGGFLPTYWQKYDGKIATESRIDSLLAWLDLPKEKRPTFLAAYISEVDEVGHDFSPDSKETGDAVERVDKAIGRLIVGLKLRKIDRSINLIVVSDHGMMRSEPQNYIISDDLFDTNDTKKVLWASEFVQVFPKEGAETKVYDSIKAKLGNYGQVYLKSSIPARYHYSEGRRIAPIFVVANPGWRFVKRDAVKRSESGERPFKLRGVHGYDNQEPDMRALFVARGPAFRKGYVSKPFENIEIYNILCQTLGLTPAKNDGDISHVKSMLRRPNR